METFEEYLETIDDPVHRERTREVLERVGTEFPDLVPRIAWNQPMYTHHGTFIIGFSVAKTHLALSPERAGILRFSGEIVAAGYEHSKQLMRIRWDQPVPWQLIHDMVEFNLADKADVTTFWRK